jgi:hypothetical protein
VLLLRGLRRTETNPTATIARERGWREEYARLRPEVVGPTVVEASADPRKPAISPARILQAIRHWRDWLADNRLPNTSVGDLEKVPILLVSDGPTEADEIVGATKVEMQRNGFLYHPSTTLAAKARAVLVPEVDPAVVQGLLLKETGGDTLPFVVWIQKADDEPAQGRYHDRVVCFYGPFRHSVHFSPPTLERE